LIKDRVITQLKILDDNLQLHEQQTKKLSRIMLSIQVGNGLPSMPAF